jgi:hypothetical protein
VGKLGQDGSSGRNGPCRPRVGKGGEGKREGEMGWPAHNREREVFGILVMEFLFLFFSFGYYKTYPLKENLILEIRKDWRTNEGTLHKAHLLFPT